ncbi:HDIG domain-containing protein [bacterium]|nr:HDIG domain-containing protein [bacterium]
MNENGEKDPQTNPEQGKGKKKRSVKLYPTLPLSLLVVIIAVTVFLFPHQGGFRYSDYSLGSISREEVLAPFTFEVLKNEDQLTEEREAARKAVEPVYVRTDSVRRDQLNNLRGTFRAADRARDSLRVYARVNDPSLIERRRELLSDVRDTYNAKINESAWAFMIGDPKRRSVQDDKLLTPELLEAILRDIYARGVIDRVRDEADATRGQIRVITDGEERSVPLTAVYDLARGRNEALTALNAELAEEVAPGDSVVKVGYELLVSFLVPNLLYDQEETESRREAAVAKVAIVDGIVLKDERIIDSNERITQHHLEVLRSMEIKRSELAREGGGWNRILPWVGRVLLAGLIYTFFGFWLYRFRPDIYRKPNRLLLFWVMVLLMVLLYGTVFLNETANPYLFPAALGTVILTIVFDAPAALIYAITMALVIGGLGGNELFTVLGVFVPAVLAVFAVLRVRTRVQIMRASLLIEAGYLLVIVMRRMLTYQLDATILSDVMYATINAFATPLLALGMLIAIELIFRVTSDLTLLELADLNRPLLKRLSLEAPGTYHHSIMVGNLAEAAAEAIEANPLLVRAGAYYHDIGKMVRREYFVENQLGQGNIHDTLEPEESAQMLADHVIQGVKIAEQYHLPEAIKAFIREHHGTGMMMFFFNKALEIRPEGKVEESTFRYPGPKPQSKETGILMLADSAEAATRSLGEPSEEKIREAVRNVIINKYRDEEMDECPLTLHDLRIIMEAFVPILQGIHHHRIRYPSREELEKKRHRSTTASANEEKE